MARGVRGSRGSRSRARLRGAALPPLALLLVAATAGCGGSGDSGGGSGDGTGPEKTRITVGTMPVADTAPLEMAMRKGFFKAEGLTVRTTTLSGGAESVSRLRAGALDISFGNYVSYFLAHANKAIDLRIVADAFQSAPRTHAVLVKKDSPVKSLKDLQDKKIGVNTKRNVSALLVKKAGKAEGASFDDDKNFAEIDMPNMETALKAGSVDAVQAVEPFVSAIEKSGTGRVVADLGKPPTAGFPVAGYAATASFAEDNPKTVAAFQRAMARAQKQAANRSTVVDTLPDYTKITAEQAAQLHLGGYPVVLDPARLRRVVALMREFGYLKRGIDVEPLLVRTGP
ncbi:ABC transporter substrate-binding protein [Streptomyces aureoverticillatus]|uniref:ABC transporter substrate-binding protein n=1 Tax=Streptomyces aureoverticillatus TaxID=66871 RepID=UPI0013D913E8|nr:ABC transporter substrate-binding protein [Streptomyces aureoverticillatus]QIB45788.1 ABC transporter substrate-binding protein [Streptomyces aureoverticillatus]